MNKDKFSVKYKIEELTPKDIQIIDSVMIDHQSYIDYYSATSKAIYPEIDKNKIKTIQKEMDKIEANMNRAKIGKGIRLVIYNKLNNKFITDLFKKVRKTELLEEYTFLEEINITIFTVYSYHIDMKIVEKYMKETEDIVKHLTDDDKWLAYNLLGLMYFKDFIKNFAKHYTN